MSLCTKVHHECCTTKYDSYCAITQSGDTKGKCRKKTNADPLKNVPLEHLVENYKGACKQSGNNAGTAAAAKRKAEEEKKRKEAEAALAAAKKKAEEEKKRKEAEAALAAAAKAEEERRQKALAAEEKKRKQAEAAEMERRKAEAAEDEDDMAAIMAKIAEMERRKAEAAEDEDDMAANMAKIAEMEKKEAAKKRKTKSKEEQKELEEAILSARNQLAASRGNSCVDLPFYKNLNDSCYMDSIIFTLMAFPSSFLSSYILNPEVSDIISRKLSELGYDRTDRERILKYVEKIQRIINKIDRELQSRQITSHLNNVPVAECVSLRIELLKDPLNALLPQAEIEKDRLDEKDLCFGNASQEDASEFVEALFRTFFIENLTTTETVTYRSTMHPDQRKQPSFKTSQTYPIYPIALDSYDFDTPEFILSTTFTETLSSDSSLRSNNILPANTKKSNGSLLTPTGLKAFNVKYPKVFDIKTTQTKLEVSGAPQDQFMILQLKRFYYDFTTKRTVKDIRPINPPKTIRLNEHSAELHLNNIIVHIGNSTKSGHYVAYFKCNGNWYLYNDMRDRIERIGTYEQLLKHRILNEEETDFKYSGTLENNCYLLFYGINDQRI